MHCLDSPCWDLVPYLVRTGLSRAIDYLLASLVDTDINATKLWFDARKDSKHLDDLFTWREKTQRPEVHHKTILCTDPVSESSIRKKPCTFGIWTPPADKISPQCHTAFLLKDTGFAMLIPGDIVRYIPLDSRGHYNKTIQQRLSKAGKISFLDSGLVWIIHKTPLVAKSMMFSDNTLRSLSKGPSTSKIRAIRWRHLICKS